jgi:hypothetical protein
MVNYNDPRRWLILQYRPGAGGKFLSAALMTINGIAHWDPMVENKKISYQQWVNEQWQHRQEHKWIAHEPLHIWNTRFFSRTFPRGEDINIDTYNKSMSSASDYFKEVWGSGKLILDFINKENIPEWWQKSKIIKLDARTNCPMHRQLLLSKIYPYDPITGNGMIMMDHPLPENPSPNARVYNNQYEFGPFGSEDEWYEYIWKTDFRLNYEIDSPDILLNDLLSWESLSKFITQVATDLSTSVNYKDLRYVFDYWISRNHLTHTSI